MERVERLEDSANAIRDGITVNPGAAEVVERANDNTHTDARTLGEQVSVM